MIMNFIDAAGVLADSAELPFHDLMAREAKSIVQATVKAYDALAPKPDEWPDGAQWYAIDSDGACNWHETEPTPDGAKWCVIDPTGDCYWHEVEPTPDSLSWESGTADFAGFVFAIPLGVDWRLCKWQRPEVAA